VTDIISPDIAPLMPGMAASSIDIEGDPTQKKLGVFFWICASWIVIVILLAIFAGLLPLPNPTFQNYAAPQNAGPAMGHLLGTDDLNRDILSRLIYGARVSLVVGFGGAIIGMIVGGIPAMISAYRRGRVDTALNTISYVLLAFPVIVALIVIIDFWGRSLWKITLIIGLFSAPLIYRVIRASTLSYATRDFVLAAKARALARGHYHVDFDDVDAYVLPVLRHRILLNFHAQSDRVEADEVLRQMLAQIRRP